MTDPFDYTDDSGLGGDDSAETPLLEPEPEPLEVIEEPMPALEPEPEPVFDLEPEPALEAEPAPEPVSEPAPGPVAEEPAIDLREPAPAERPEPAPVDLPPARDPFDYGTSTDAASPPPAPTTASTPSAAAPVTTEADVGGAGSSLPPGEFAAGRDQGFDLGPDGELVDPRDPDQFDDEGPAPTGEDPAPRAEDPELDPNEPGVPGDGSPGRDTPEDDIAFDQDPPVEPSPDADTDGEPPFGMDEIDSDPELWTEGLLDRDGLPPLDDGPVVLVDEDTGLVWNPDEEAFQEVRRDADGNEVARIIGPEEFRFLSRDFTSEELEVISAIGEQLLADPDAGLEIQLGDDGPKASVRALLEHAPEEVPAEPEPEPVDPVRPETPDDLVRVRSVDPVETDLVDPGDREPEPGPPAEEVQGPSPEQIERVSAALREAGLDNDLQPGKNVGELSTALAEGQGVIVSLDADELDGTDDDDTDHGADMNAMMRVLAVDEEAGTVTLVGLDGSGERVVSVEDFLDAWGDSGNSALMVDDGLALAGAEVAPADSDDAGSGVGRMAAGAAVMGAGVGAAGYLVRRRGQLPSEEELEAVESGIDEDLKPRSSH